ncbi:MAG TPA: ergothioneine biosynthesis protein EgtC [Mycobacteriales bacterium]|nr:ergothioneine biosynthesis protein EgtC [Mycobacteriales bacterium]
MCRHVAWIGRPRSVADLVLRPPYGLLTQSYAPRRQCHGTMNADGWGVAFHAEGRTEPARWRSDRPLWTDPSFASVATELRSTCILAAVRSATVGMPADETAAAPFVSGRWALSHNGVVDRSVVPLEPAAESMCDSALLAAHVFAIGAERLGDTVPKIAARDPHARLNLLATDGEQILATTWGDTLSILVQDGGIAVASEPYDDDPRWQDVPDRHLVRASGDGLTVTALEDIRI